ncbi:Uncharacterised protein [Bordetella pertussis]|nr:Uncharacterised protein [Bordetella pertussis]
MVCRNSTPPAPSAMPTSSNTSQRGMRRVRLPG